MKSKNLKKTTSWLERINPLWGLSLRESQLIYDTARMGNYARLQYIYSQIEKTDPVLLTCVERRSSALLGLGWKVVVNKGVSEEEGAEQIAKTEEMLNGIDNLTDAIEHLGLSFFRGFSHCSPLYDENGNCYHIDLLNSWNFCQDPNTGRWHWNADANGGASFDQLPEIPSGELISVVRPRAIDYPALPIYIRQALAERNWGRFLERYGIPPCIITMPANATREQEEEYKQAAAMVAEALNGTLPAGSAVNFATEARGTDPFSAFIEHQQKLVVLLATGGTLTSLAEAGSGTLAGNAQMDVWREIVSRDASIIGNAINKVLVTPYLERVFGEAKCHFELGKDAEQSPLEILQLAKELTSAGYKADPQWITEKTGIKLAEAEAPLLVPETNKTEPKTNKEQEDEEDEEPLEPMANTKSKRKLTRAEKALKKDLSNTLKSAKAILDAKSDAEFYNLAQAFVSADAEEIGLDCSNLEAHLAEVLANTFAETTAEIKDDEPYEMKLDDGDEQ